MSRDEKVMAALREWAYARVPRDESIQTMYDALAAAGCLLTPVERAALASGLEWVKWTASSPIGDGGKFDNLLIAFRAYRAATEPPKYVAEHFADHSSAWHGDGTRATFHGPDRRADCEAWVAIKNGGRA
jgi:hypothetical protein